MCSQIQHKQDNIVQKKTCDFESSLTIGQLQCKQPSKQLSYWCNWHERQPRQLRDLTKTCFRTEQEQVKKRTDIPKSVISDLTDGSVSSPVSHDNVGMKIDAVQLHWSPTHIHGSAYFTANSLWGTWGE